MESKEKPKLADIIHNELEMLHEKFEYDLNAFKQEFVLQQVYRS
jgi:hypothetical protein